MYLYPLQTKLEVLRVGITMVVNLFVCQCKLCPVYMGGVGSLTQNNLLLLKVTDQENVEICELNLSYMIANRTQFYS